MPWPITANNVTIANGESLSSGTYIGHGKFVAIITPAAWTAAVITFQGSYDGVTYYDIYDGSGTEVSFTVDASRYVVVDSLESCVYIKLRSGTAGAAVNQLAARTLTLVTQKFSGIG